MQIITQTTTKLEKVKQDLRSEICAAPIEADTHRQYMQLPCFNTIEQGGEGTTTFLPRDFRVIAWNMERCLKIKDSVHLLKRPDADIILLSEMDNGMARTGQKHTTKRLAKQLGMYYLYGVEFLELSLGNDADQQYAEDDFNKRGFHGNAILSKMPITKAAMLRFDDDGYWFAGQTRDGKISERRVGGRMALFAIVLNEAEQPVCVVSAHLESNATTELRDKQMFDLMATAESFAGSGVPIIIGGDLNTGNLRDGRDHTAETLFETAENQGFHWRANHVGLTTRPSLLNTHSERRKKLDWFCARHIESHFQKIIPALDEDNMPLSDHEAILADWSFDNERPIEKSANKPSGR